MKIEFKAEGLNIYPSREEKSGYTLFVLDEDRNTLAIAIPLKLIYKLGRDIKAHEPDFDSCRHVAFCPYSTDYCTVKHQEDCIILKD
ncbi:unnamed protein product [marine sediment metagenome]|uniref:Uncharacterized protein n=1 Tax=marine sediment metagenome TaxID=412755 RepID=X0ZAM5_9ZZZZ